METVDVNLGDRSYPIYIGSGILSNIGSTLQKCTNSKKIAIVTNPTVEKLYLDVVKKSFEGSGFTVIIIKIPDGEEYKSLEWAEKIFDDLISFQMDRYSPLVALGGGVIGDITGFVAATYLRGVPFVQIPTTLLAQVDSSVGGKTAVNHRSGKNLIGAFYQPLFVYIDLETLKTLEPREFNSGLAEVVKYGVIKNSDFFEYLENNSKKILALDKESLLYIVRNSCIIKSEVVAADERESGYRAILNFGHTFGHALEAITEYQKFRHGEAVAIGMVFAAYLSYAIGKCEESVIKRIVSLLSAFNLPNRLTVELDNNYLDAIFLDKKVVGSKINFVFSKSIGDVVIDLIEVDEIEAIDPFMSKTYCP